MIVGGYTLNLYCDNKAVLHHAHSYDGITKILVGKVELLYEFVGRTEAQCLRQAKSHGWRISRDKLVLCPVCAQNGVTFKDIRRLNDAENLG